MANTHFSGPVYSENGWRVVPVGSSGYYIAEDTDGSLKIGAGGTVGSNVAIAIDASGNVQITNLETDLVVESGLIKQENDTGSVELTGSDAADESSNVKLYGASHATKAGDIELRDATTIVWGYDKSDGTWRSRAANGMVIGADNAASGELAFNAGATNTALINMGNNDGAIQVTGGTNASNSSRLIIYGGSHASQAEDIVLENAAGTDVFFYDHSVNSLKLNRDTTSSTFLSGVSLQLGFAGAASAAFLITKGGGSEGSMELTADTGANTGGNFKAFGVTHATSPATAQLRSGSAVRIAVNGTGIGFFSVAPVARPAAYTPTNVTPDRSYDADTVAVAELADVVGTLIADLQAYGLLQ